ncbi:MAG: phosphonate C-P lyase system protein PhnH [Hyphomicrobiales bacterium]|jgi:alpha-D-ribose 1-methylphosphonate 5-triphosphate synthase subunit PhnH
MQQQSAFEGGFANPSHEAAHAFRAAMRAMARPGTVEAIKGGSAPWPTSAASATLLLTLCDPDTGVHLAGAYDNEDVREWVTFHTGATLVSSSVADFALGTWEGLQPISRFKIGTSEYPDRAATLVVDLPELSQSGARLVGPGIKDCAFLNLPELAAFQANRKLFPLGFDCFFCAGGQIAALPRSTIVSEAG